MGKRHSPESISIALRQLEAGTPATEIARKMGIHENTLYLWQKKYGSLGTPEVRELRELREVNRKLKQLVADLSLDRKVLQDVISNKWRSRCGVRSLATSGSNTATANAAHACSCAITAHRCTTVRKNSRSIIVDQWAYWNAVKIDFSRPGKSTDNAYCESFNGTVRKEVLNASWFLTLESARGTMREWRRHYNAERLHGSLGHKTPEEFALTAKSQFAS